MSSDDIPDVGPAFIAVPRLLVTQHSLGGVVDLVYVRVGNEVMAGALSKLQSALSATQSSLSALTDLQGLHNQIAVGAKSAISNMFNFKASNQTLTVTQSITTTFPFSIGSTIITDTTTDGVTTTIAGVTILPSFTSSFTSQITKVVDSADSYVSGYNLIASSYYGNPIDPYWAITVPGATTATPITVNSISAMSPAMLSAYNYFIGRIAQSKATISALITKLTPLTPTLADGSEDPTTLLAKLKTVYNELPNGSFASTKAWVLDGYTTHGASGIVKAGLLQQDITNAITAGESLNSSQNASVRNYMFIFEQYYQSAASIMSSLHQAILGMSRKITQ
jgi:hypothetical protein